jgi:hypothetical protein
MEVNRGWLYLGGVQEAGYFYHKLNRSGDGGVEQLDFQ